MNKLLLTTLGAILTLSLQIKAQELIPPPQGPLPVEEVNLSISLSASECLRFPGDHNKASCSSSIIMGTPEKVTLDTIGYDCPSSATPPERNPSPLNSEECTPSIWRGDWIKTKYTLGFRYIGIVTITKYASFDGTGSGSYNIEVEILNGTKRVAKMNTVVHDWTQLQAVTLEAPEVEQTTSIGSTVTSTVSLYIGKAIALEPLPPVDSPSPHPMSSNRTLSKAKWNLLMGNLK